MFPQNNFDNIVFSMKKHKKKKKLKFVRGMVKCILARFYFLTRGILHKNVPR